MNKSKIAVLLAGALLATGCAGLPKESADPPVDVLAPVTTQREVTAATRGPIDSRVKLSVSFGSQQQQSLYLRTGGRLKRQYVRVGEHVAAGKLLAELESGTQPYDVEVARLDLQRKQLALDTAKSRQGFTDAPSAADLKRDELDLQQAQMALQQKQESLAGTQLYAPFSGQVISLAFNEGDQADAYKEILVLAGDGQVAARAKADDSTAAQLQVGQPVDIFPQDADPAAIPGKVVRTPPVGATNGDQTVVIVPDKPSPRLQIGRNGKVEVIVQAKPDALLVPLSAVRSFGGRQFVTVVKGEARQEVAVKTGLSNDKYIEVTDGLQPGDRVISR